MTAPEVPQPGRSSSGVNNLPLMGTIPSIGKHLSAYPEAFGEPLLISLSDAYWRLAHAKNPENAPCCVADLLPERAAKRGLVVEREIVDSALDLHLNQGRRIGYGQAAQSDGIQQLKDGCVCSDAEREGDDGGGGEDRALAQRAQGKPQVLKHGLEPERATRG